MIHFSVLSDHDTGEPQGAAEVLRAHVAGASARGAGSQLGRGEVRHGGGGHSGGECRHTAGHVRRLQGGTAGRWV